MSRRGFTLLEVLIVVGITGVLVSSLGLFVSQIASTREFVRTRAERDAAITTIFDALENSLATSVARAHDGGPGISGDGLSIEVSFDGTTVQRAMGGVPERVLQPADRVGISFDSSSGHFSIKRDGTSPSTLAGPIFAARFRFFDGELWHDEWDSLAMNGLPAAVECSTWFKPWPDDEIPEWFPDEFASFEVTKDIPEEEEAFDSFGTLRELDEREDLPAPSRRRLMLVPDAKQVDEDAFFEEAHMLIEIEEEEPEE
jgi:prepilin-type N-terminal cleavage/methylation domain-containing protein